MVVSVPVVVPVPPAAVLVLDMAAPPSSFTAVLVVVVGSFKIVSLSSEDDKYAVLDVVGVVGVGVLEVVFLDEDDVPAEIEVVVVVVIVVAAVDVDVIIGGKLFLKDWKESKLPPALWYKPFPTIVVAEEDDSEDGI